MLFAAACAAGLVLTGCLSTHTNDATAEVKVCVKAPAFTADVQAGKTAVTGQWDVHALFHFLQRNGLFPHPENVQRFSLYYDNDESTGFRTVDRGNFMEVFQNGQKRLMNGIFGVLRFREKPAGYRKHQTAVAQIQRLKGHSLLLCGQGLQVEKHRFHLPKCLFQKQYTREMK